MLLTFSHCFYMESKVKALDIWGRKADYIRLPGLIALNLPGPDGC